MIIPKENFYLVLVRLPWKLEAEEQSESLSNSMGREMEVEEEGTEYSQIMTISTQTTKIKVAEEKGLWWILSYPNVNENI